MDMELTERRGCIATVSRAAVCLLVLGSALSLRAQEAASNEGDEAKGTNEPDETIEAAWQPKSYKFSRYQRMLAKAPFGKVPANAPAPAPAPVPVEDKQLAIAAVSVVEGKPVVYLVDLKTRAYQKVDTEKENEGNNRLVEVTDAANPREVVATVLIDGRLTTVKYDTAVLDAKPKMVAKSKGRPVNVAANRALQAQRVSQANTANSPALAQSSNPSPENHPPVPTADGEAVPRAVNRLAPAAGGLPPVPVTRSIQDQRRLSTVPRRRVIVPGQSTQPQSIPAASQTPPQE